MTTAIWHSIDETPKLDGDGILRIEPPVRLLGWGIIFLDQYTGYAYCEIEGVWFKSDFGRPS